MFIVFAPAPWHNMIARGTAGKRYIAQHGVAEPNAAANVFIIAAPAP